VAEQLAELVARNPVDEALLKTLEEPEPSNQDEQDERDGLHWKTRALVGWAAGRSFVWVDDEITDTDRAWVSAHHRGQILLHRVDPRQGLTDADFVAVNEWLRHPPARVRPAAAYQADQQGQALPARCR
jgi:hypothetical protein